MNYKQITVSLITFCIAIYIPLVTAYAQSATTTPTPTDGEITATPTPVDYQLPYPGMLPDNPLYFLKVFRDSLTAIFLNKPLDKANFDLLQSDKNAEASYLLVIQQQGKGTLALQTFSQGQDYFDQAVTQTISAKKQGYSTQELAKELAAANQKHVQLLQAIAQQTHQNNSGIVQHERNRAGTFAQQIKSLQE